MSGLHGVTPPEQLPTDPILNIAVFPYGVRRKSNDSRINLRNPELAKLADKFTAYAREMRAELNELQQQLEVIRQYQVLTHRHTNRPN